MAQDGIAIDRDVSRAKRPRPVAAKDLADALDLD
jgi:hypothetical protein